MNFKLEITNILLTFGSWQKSKLVNQLYINRFFQSLRAIILKHMPNNWIIKLYGKSIFSSINLR